MAFLFSFHCDSPDQGSAKSRSGKLVCRGLRTLAKQSPISLASSAGCSQAAKWPPGPGCCNGSGLAPTDRPSAARGGGLARTYADAYGKLQSGRCESSESLPIYRFVEPKVLRLQIRFQADKSGQI